MGSILCCVANQWPTSPKLPCRKPIQAFDTEQRLFDFTAISPDSRFMSSKTEELHDFRRLLQDAKTDPIEQVQADSASSAGSHKPKSRATFLPNEPSRDNTKPNVSLKPEHITLKKPKHDIQRNLVSNSSSNTGGNDSDAPIFEDVDEIDPAEHGIPHRGGRKGCRPSIQNIQWAATAPTR